MVVILKKRNLRADGLILKMILKQREKKAVGFLMILMQREKRAVGMTLQSAKAINQSVQIPHTVLNRNALTKFFT
jgi:hypothetical protein